MSQASSVSKRKNKWLKTYLLKNFWTASKITPSGLSTSVHQGSSATSTSRMQKTYHLIALTLRHWHRVLVKMVSCTLFVSLGGVAKRPVILCSLLGLKRRLMLMEGPSPVRPQASRLSEAGKQSPWKGRSGLQQDHSSSLVYFCQLSAELIR